MPVVGLSGPRLCGDYLYGLFVRDGETSVRIGLRGGGCSPHRTSLHPPDSLITGKLTAYFADWGSSRRFSRPIDGLIQWLAARFPTQQNSESFSRNSESFFTEQRIFCAHREWQNRPAASNPRAASPVSTIFPRRPGHRRQSPRGCQILLPRPRASTFAS